MVIPQLTLKVCQQTVALVPEKTAPYFMHLRKKTISLKKKNIDRFDENFRFQITDSEFKNLRSKISTSSWGGTRYLPYAFTEQGIYMLMTVLKGELAVRQSKALIMLFKEMKDFIIQSQNIISRPEFFKLSIQTQSNTEDIKQIKQQMVTRDDISIIIKDFTDPNIKNHVPIRLVN